MSGIGFGTSKTKKSKVQKSSVFSGLSDLQARYLVHRAKGNSKRKAAKLAGYSGSTAEVATRAIETPQVRAAWESILQAEFREEELIGVLREGLAATKPIAAAFKGTITDVVLTPDHTERRKNAELIAMMSGRYTKTERVQSESVSFNVTVDL